MKKLFYAVVALSLFATSCAKSDAPEAKQEMKTITLSVVSPEMQTRAEFSAGSGTLATTLYYAFYSEWGEYLADVSKPEGITWNPLTGIKIPVSFIPGRAYKAVFWADANVYVVDLEKDFADLTIDTGDCPVGNEEEYDAFWATVEIDLTEDGDYEHKPVILTRPFAQLNIGVPVTDLEEAEKVGVIVGGVGAGVKTVPTIFSLATGKATDKKHISVDMAVAGTDTITIDGVEYVILSTNYLLVGAEKCLVDVDFTMCESDEGGDSVDRYFTNIPLQRNHRTFILGNILTEGGEMEYFIKVDPSFKGDTFVDENGNEL